MSCTPRPRSPTPQPALGHIQRRRAVVSARPHHHDDGCAAVTKVRPALTARAARDYFSRTLKTQNTKTEKPKNTKTHIVKVHNSLS